VYIGFWWGNLREGDHLEDPGMDKMIILKLTFEKWDGRIWTGLSWPRVRTSGGLLLMRYLTFGFHEMRGIS
jgi:hypothetical protein